jgi:MFS transporter, PAT family, solute carrier family 33 (acetyl-CoA transportor), member 1
VLILLTATQDIAVDGWAISMLSEANQGFAGTCQVRRWCPRVQLVPK